MTEALFLELLEAAFAAYKEWKAGNTAATQTLVDMRAAALGIRAEVAAVEAADDKKALEVLDKRFPAPDGTEGAPPTEETKP